MSGANTKTLPRDVVVGFRVNPETARVIRKAARRDGRTVSSFLARLVERVLAKDEAAE